MAPAAIDPNFCRVCVRLCNGIYRDEYFVYPLRKLCLKNPLQIRPNVKSEKLRFQILRVVGVVFS